MAEQSRNNFIIAFYVEIDKELPQVDDLYVDLHPSKL